MSRRIATWIVALGCVAALAASIWRDRVDEAPRPTNAPQHASARAVSESSEPGFGIDVAESSAQEEQRAPKLQDKRPLEERFAVPTELTKLPVSKIADANSEESRQFFWSYLRTFAAKADLTEAEWLRFLGDISDVAASEIAADEVAGEEHAWTDSSQLSNELALELDERCASWMTEKQLKVYQFRINALGVIAQTRNLKTFAHTAAILSDAQR